jgi:hypothetical protein
LIGICCALDTAQAGARADCQGYVGERGSLAHTVGRGVGWAEEGDEGGEKRGVGLVVALGVIEDETQGGPGDGFGAVHHLRDVSFDEGAEAEVAAVGAPGSDDACLEVGADFGVGDVERQGEVCEEWLGGWSARGLSGDAEAEYRQERESE